MDERRCANLECCKLLERRTTETLADFRRRSCCDRTCAQRYRRGATYQKTREKACENCGCIFPFQGRSRRTCSDACESEYRTTDKTQDWGTKICDVCEKPFGRRLKPQHESRSQFEERKFCGHQCKGTMLAKANSMEFPTKRCQKCQREFGRRSNEIAGNYHHRMTCSTRCANRLSIDHRRQGVTRRQPWSADFTSELRKEIKERDGRECQVCKSNPGGRGLHVHHIDYLKDNSHPSNLITLCWGCHAKTNFDRDWWYQFFTNLMLDRDLI